MKGLSSGDTGEQSQAQNAWRAPALEHVTLYVQSRFLWDADQDFDALFKEYCTTFYGPAGAAMLDALDFAERNLAVNDQSRGAGKANPANVPPAISLQLRDKLAEAQKTAGDTIYGRRIAAISAELMPREELIAADAKKRAALAEARAKAPTARARHGDDLSETKWYLLKDNRTGEDPEVQTKFRLGWTDKAVIFDVFCLEPRMKQLQVSPDVYSGDNLAISIETPLHSYYHLEINPDGKIVDGNPGPDWQSLAEVYTEPGKDF